MALYLRASLSLVGLQWLHGIFNVYLDLLFTTLHELVLLAVQLQLREGGVAEEAALHEVLDAVEVVHRFRNDALLDVLVGMAGLL